ncbi:hypothetical protein WJX77_011300 [Trebouxia sp. C0004]
MPYALMAAQAWSRARKVGITLTAAQCVIFAELYWNPGPLIQAEDRAHRIGQKSSVLTRYLISPGSSDDIMWSQVTKKLQVVGKALDGNDESIAGLQLTSSNNTSLQGEEDPALVDAVRCLSGCLALGLVASVGLLRLMTVARVINVCRALLLPFPNEFIGTRLSLAVGLSSSELLPSNIPGLLTDALKASKSSRESSMTEEGILSGRAASVTDLDADLLGVKLDDCSRYFKKEIMGFFLDSKAKLTFEGRALAEAEQLKGAAELAESQARLESLKQELHHERQVTAKTEAVLDRVASSYATARHYAHQNHLVALAMFEWHSFARQQKAMRQHLRQAVKHYDSRKLQGQVFQHWKRWCNLEGRSNRQEVIQRKEEVAKQAAWEEAGVIIEDLTAALSDAQQQLRKERAARDQLEEDMKQSFMRSVCAINLEAMSVMKRGMPPAGVNPVPIKVSVPAPYASPVKQLGKQPDVASFAAAEPQQQGQDGAEEAQRSNEEEQDRLNVIEEESDAVPLGDMHHPILGMKSPYRTFSVQEDGSATAADLAEAATRPIRQSSAIHFNAALGGWGNTPSVPVRPLPGTNMHAAVKTVQSAVVQPLATSSTAMLSQRVGQTGAVPVSSNQQELRPRSSNGILQRITVDRGPATGAAGTRAAPLPLQRRQVQRNNKHQSLQV